MEAEPSAARKTALVILGMHRSGTSAMTRVLSLAGAQLPSTLMLPGEGNLVGHWEPRDIQEFNDEVLDALDSDWSDTFGPRQGHQRKLPTRKYVSGARDLIQSNYDEGDFIVLKEPRISILMDLWKEALAEAGYSAAFVIMVRHPLEVADSLKARNGLVENRSLILWTQYMLSCEVGTRDSKRVFVKFDDLLTDVESVLDRIETELDLQFPRRTWQSNLETQEFLRKQERHHKLDGPRPMTGFAELSRLYDFFEAASQGASLNIDVAMETTQWLERLETTFGPVLKKSELELKASQRALVAVRTNLEVREAEFIERFNEASAEIRAANQRAVDVQRRAEDLGAQLAERTAEVGDLSGSLAAARERTGDLETALTAVQTRLDRQEIDFSARLAEMVADANDASRISETLANTLTEANAALARSRAAEEGTTRALSETKAFMGSIQDQSAELARALSEAVIAREQMDQLSPAELMGKAVRRLFSRAWLS